MFFLSFIQNVSKFFTCFPLRRLLAVSGYKQMSVLSCRYSSPKIPCTVAENPGNSNSEGKRKTVRVREGGGGGVELSGSIEYSMRHVNNR